MSDSTSPCPNACLGQAAAVLQRILRAVLDGELRADTAQGARIMRRIEGASSALAAEHRSPRKAAAETPDLYTEGATLGGCERCRCFGDADTPAPGRFHGPGGKG